jgi:hypothetical protein
MKRTLHRLAEARKSQNVNIKTVSRILGVSVEQAKSQEIPSCDLKISEIHEWQRALNIPISELLVEGDHQLSGPVLERSKMVRLMRTALELRDDSTKGKVSALKQMLVEQILELMPDLVSMTKENR